LFTALCVLYVTAEKDILSKHRFKHIAIDMVVQLFGLNVTERSIAGNRIAAR